MATIARPMLVEIVGVTFVFADDDKVVTNREQLLRFDDHHDDERFTDYLGGSGREDNLVAAIEPSGHLLFKLTDEGTFLQAVTQYRTKRPLTDKELCLLFDYTIGQWDDGIGESIATEAGLRHGFSVQCQTNNPLPIIWKIESS
jgi:hypothetical protein